MAIVTLSGVRVILCTANYTEIDRIICNHNYNEIDGKIWARCSIKPYKAEIIAFKPWRPKGLFQFENIINVFFSSFILI